MLHAHNNKPVNHSSMQPHIRTIDKKELSDAIDEAMRQSNGAYDGKPRPHVVWYADGQRGYDTSKGYVGEYR